MRRAAIVRTHHFTVDVEEYFQVSAFEASVSSSAWEHFESRVDGTVDRLMQLLDEHEARGTFFVLGWVAERHRDMVRGIVAAGHEVASHGWDHRRVTSQGPAEFRSSVRRSKELLEDLTGTRVLGFRAPSFSIVPGYEWALDVLIEEGYAYDSSLFPVRRPGYGYPNGRRDPHRLQCPAGQLIELPPATLRICGVNLPAGGGAYFRMLPYRFVRAALRDYEDRGFPATFYIHPWEVDPDQPRLAVPWFSKLRHYTGLGRTGDRLRRLLREFRFTSILETVSSL